MSSPVPLSEMTLPALRDLHNELAAAREQPLMTIREARERGRAGVGQAIGMLRTIRPVTLVLGKAARPPKPRPLTPLRDAIIEALSIVTHFEDRKTGKTVSYDELHLHNIEDLRSVGLPYAACLERVKKKNPDCQVILAHLRGAVLSARKGAVGYVGVTFADSRPHGMKGRGRKIIHTRKPRK